MTQVGPTEGPKKMEKSDRRSRESERLKDAMLLALKMEEEGRGPRKASNL